MTRKPSIPDDAADARLPAFFFAHDDPVQEPAHDADEQRPEQGPSEPVHAEAGDERRGQPEADRVEDEDEEAEREQRQRQRQQEQHPADDGVDEAEDDAGNKRRREAVHVEARQYVGRQNDGHTVEQEAREKSHQWLSPSTEHGPTGSLSGGRVLFRVDDVPRRY